MVPRPVTSVEFGHFSPTGISVASGGSTVELGRSCTTVQFNKYKKHLINIELNFLGEIPINPLNSTLAMSTTY